MDNQVDNNHEQKDKPRFYPVKNEAFDGHKYLQEHNLELCFDFDQVNGMPVMIVSKKQ